MKRMAGYEPLPEERLAGLLAELPPAPEGWVQAAAMLPAARRELDRIVTLAEQDAEFRARTLADLESAFRAAGLEPTRALLDAARVRLEGDDRPR
ncbi:MAG TPA: hypothetical protein VFT42_05045 [Solirubrobacteraceae bacterium]|nr:hypothetical protein [Solirubrobacteraceae bacterium]